MASDGTREDPIPAAVLQLRSVGIAAIAALIYLPALRTGFNADDYLILWRIKSIAGLGEPLAYFQFAFYEYFRPLTFLSYALDWHIWGLNPAGFHLTNIALHAANAVLVFRLAHRLFPGSPALVAGLLFALHPASHEVVYWVAARFDLLATFFVLVSMACIARPGTLWFVGGVVAFALALLSKESALSLLIVIPAWDIFVQRRGFRETAVRLTPLLLVVALYAATRSLGADLDAAGGGRRLPKLMMTIGALAALMFVARSRDTRRHLPAQSVRPPARAAQMFLAGAVVIAAGLVLTPSSFGWASEKLGYVAHVLFFSLSPVILPPPDPSWFEPSSRSSALILLGLVSGAAALAVGSWRLVSPRSRDTYTFILVLFLAALLPVSSMTGGLRYLYLPSVAIALLLTCALLLVPRSARLAAIAVVMIALMASAQQLLRAGQIWKAASVMTDEGLALMAGAVQRCGEEDILLLTTPVGIGDVYVNFSWDAFEVVSGCPPKRFMTLLRVVRNSVSVVVVRSSPTEVQFLVPMYTGNILASEDLRNFGTRVIPGERRTLETPAGRLETYPEGTAQAFRLTLSDDAREAKRFYFSDGRIRQ